MKYRNNIYPSKIRKSGNITDLKCLAAFNTFCEISEKAYKASINKYKFTYIYQANTKAILSVLKSRTSFSE